MYNHISFLSDFYCPFSPITVPQERPRQKARQKNCNYCTQPCMHQSHSASTLCIFTHIACITLLLKACGTPEHMANSNHVPIIDLCSATIKYIIPSHSGRCHTFCSFVVFIGTIHVIHNVCKDGSICQTDLVTNKIHCTK